MTFTHPRHAALWARITPPSDLAHDGDHLLRVYWQAVALAPEAGADPDLCGAAALVHDLVDVPKESPERPQGGARSAQAAAPLLAEVGYLPGEVARVTEAVRTSSWSRGLAPTCPEGVALQDADRLDAIGAIGVARALTTAQAMASRGAKVRLYHPEDPLAQGRVPDDRRYALDHFPVKLLRLAEALHTPSARAEGRRRQEALRCFLEALAREVEPPSRAGPREQAPPGDSGAT
ncbi:MAG: HD domain-containing protein [Deltaproteobacteria bacterium]|nr:HD domain-containing protein [Deltaproteobacteria bacterium]